MLMSGGLCVTGHNPHLGSMGELALPLASCGTQESFWEHTAGVTGEPTPEDMSVGELVLPLIWSVVWTRE